MIMQSGKERKAKKLIRRQQAFMEDLPRKKYLFILSAVADFFNYMALTRQQRKEIIDDLKDKISRQKTMVFVDFAGLKVKDLSGLRRKLKKSDSLFKVSKKNLLKVALKDSTCAET